MRLPTRYLDIISALVLICLAAWGGTFIFKYNLAETAKVRLEEQLFHQQKKDLDLAQNNIATLKQLLADYRSFLTDLNQRIPGTTQIGPFLSTLHGMIDQHRVTLVRVLHDPPQATGRYHRIMLHLEFQGEFKRIYALIHSLETANRLFIIDTIQLTRQDSSTGCTAQISANIYYE